MKLEALVAMSRHGDPRLSGKGKLMAINILPHICPVPAEARGILSPGVPPLPSEGDLVSSSRARLCLT